MSLKIFRAQFIPDLKMNFFKLHIFLSKFVSFLPLELNFIPERFKFYRKLINILYMIFWHFVCIHILLLQFTSIFIQYNDPTDEIINYVSIGSFYGLGYFLLCYMQFYSKDFLDIIEFANRKFQKRSAKGERYFI